MRQKFVPVVLVLILVAGLALTACGGDDGDDGPSEVKIAVSAPLSLDVGQDVVNALEMALEEHDGKVGNVEVSLLVLNSSDPNGSPVSTEVEAEIAAQAADDKSVVAYIGPMTTDQAKTSIPILNEAGIVTVSESATGASLTKAGFGPGEPGIYYPTGKRTFFRVLPADDAQAVGAAQWIDDLGFSSVFVVSAGTSYGNSISGIFEVAAQDAGLAVIDASNDPQHLYYQLDPEALEPDDLAPVIEAVGEADPDIVYFGGGAVPSGIPFITALRAAYPDLPVMGPDGLQQSELIEGVGAAAEGIYVTNLTVPAAQIATASAFVESFQEKYDKEPDPYVLAAYAAIESVLAAIEEADKVTRAGVLDAMTELESVEGVFGSWSFDANGDTTFRTLSGWRVENGEWVFVDVIG